MARTVKISCAQCGEDAFLATGWVNRSRKKGDNLYCGRRCSGLGRRNNRTAAENKSIKREYDKKYRADNLARLKEQKQAHHQRTYNPVQAAAERKKNMKRHLQYCRQPAYRAYKKSYDQKYLAKKNFGDFYEAALILAGIESEISSRVTRHEVYLANGTLNKHQQRRREYDRINSNKS